MNCCMTALPPTAAYSPAIDVIFCKHYVVKAEHPDFDVLNSQDASLVLRAALMSVLITSLAALQCPTALGNLYVVASRLWHGCPNCAKLRITGEGTPPAANRQQARQFLLSYNRDLDPVEPEQLAKYRAALVASLGQK